MDFVPAPTVFFMKKSRGEGFFVFFLWPCQVSFLRPSKSALIWSIIALDCLWAEATGFPDTLLFYFIWPDAVTEVKTDIYVTSFGPVSDTDMVSIVPGKVKWKMMPTVQRK